MGREALKGEISEEGEEEKVGRGEGLGVRRNSGTRGRELEFGVSGK